MRRKLVFGTMAFMVLLAGAMVVRAEDAPQGGPGGQGPPTGQHQFRGGGQHQFGGMGHRQLEGRGRWGGYGRRGMGWQRGGRWGGYGRRGMGWQRGGPGFGGGAGLLRMAENPRVREELKLTDDQVSRLHNLAVESEKTSIKTRSDLQLRTIELRELVRADNPNREAILSKVQQISDLRGQMAKQRMETMLSARGVLTADQLKKVRSFMESGGFRGPSGPGGPGGPGGGRMMERRGGQGRPGGAPSAPSNPPAHPATPSNP